MAIYRTKRNTGGSPESDPYEWIEIGGEDLHLKIELGALRYRMIEMARRRKRPKKVS